MSRPFTYLADQVDPRKAKDNDMICPEDVGLGSGDINSGTTAIGSPASGTDDDTGNPVTAPDDTVRSSTSNVSPRQTTIAPPRRNLETWLVVFDMKSGQESPAC